MKKTDLEDPEHDDGAPMGGCVGGGGGVGFYEGRVDDEGDALMMAP